MKLKLILIAAGLLLVLFSYSSAQVPQLINYQGKLTKSTGAPLDTTISMFFSIYADSAGTILKWTETQGAVVVEKGIFNVLLGNVNPIPDTVFNGNIRYLGVKVGGDPEITPRKPMVSVPYAYRSATGAGDNDWTINGDTVYHLNGNVGIGTATPTGLLDVRGAGTDGGAVVTTGNSDLSHLLIFFSGRLNDPNPFILWKDGDPLRFATDASGFSERMRVTSSGNVGIGTTNPNEQLEITGNLRLPASTASVGVIKSGANRFIHNFGTDNFFAGVNAGNFTTSGWGGNTGVGSSALQALTTGYYNTAVGYYALYSNTTGNENTAVGIGALYGNTGGHTNTAVGRSALQLNTTGNYNTAVGMLALSSNTSGYQNTAIGYAAGVSPGYAGLTNATAIGYAAVVAVSNAMVLGGTGLDAVNVGIGTTSPQGALDVVSTTGALIVPRMTTAQRDALTAINGMIIYNTTTNQFNFYEAGAWAIK